MPEAVQTPLLEHGGEQVNNSTLSNDNDPKVVV